MKICSGWYLHFHFAHTTLTFIILIISIFLSIRVILSNNKQKQSLERSIYYISYIFILITLLLYILFMAKTMSECYVFYHNIHYYFSICYGILYFLQLYFLDLILFLRLYSVFKESPYRLTNTLVAVYVMVFGLFFLIFVLSIMSELVMENGIVAHSVMVILILGFFIIFSLSIMHLFIHKLYQTYKLSRGDYCNQNGVNKLVQNISSAMTQNSILATLSLGISIIAVLNRIVSELWLNHSYKQVAHCINYSMHLLDIASNFMAVSLTFAINKKYYLLIFGCIDKRCKAICDSMATSNDVSHANPTRNVYQDDTETVTIELNRNSE